MKTCFDYTEITKIQSDLAWNEIDQLLLTAIL